jgi:hypothetical protein
LRDEDLRYKIKGCWFIIYEGFELTVKGLEFTVKGLQFTVKGLEKGLGFRV